MNKNKILSILSNLGRSLMMPIAALSAAGIFLGLSSALKRPEIIELLPFLGNEYVFYAVSMIGSVSGVVFTLIPALFAISIALGLAKTDKETAAFAGFVGYYTFLVSASILVKSGFIAVDNLRVASILGVETIDMGAVAGILTGLIVASLHNKYHNIKFPDAIAFYGGKRFVTIVVIVVMALVGQIMPFVWGPVSNAINLLGELITSAGQFGVFIFGFLERLLIPTGLHHILNSVFRTTSIGGVLDGVEGALNIFLQNIGQVDMSVLAPYTRFLAQGKFPFMIFGLPAAGLAIYQTTPEDKKSRVKALLIAAVAASFVSGITEPIEFAFMFIAPPLFLFHSIMGGLSFMLVSMAGVVIGNTGGGLIDLVIWGVMQPGSNWFRVILIGIPFAFIYYYTFKWYFTKKGIVIESTDEELEYSDSPEVNEISSDTKSLNIVKGLGGFDNIVSVDNCISRLRVDINDSSLVDESLLKSTGAMGIIKQSDKHVHVVYGPAIESVAIGVKKIIKENN